MTSQDIVSLVVAFASGGLAGALARHNGRTRCSAQRAGIRQPRAERSAALGTLFSPTGWDSSAQGRATEGSAALGTWVLML
jgi:hypothetical protein